MVSCGRRLKKAGNDLSYARSDLPAVMSHGAIAGREGDAKFSADHNFHFFSHAYLTASLIGEHGVDPHNAEAISGLVGSQYELQDYSLQEGSGNSGIKDILMNSEGAAFGASLLEKSSTALPGKTDGPPAEIRARQCFPDLHLLPPDADAVSKRAMKLNNPLANFDNFESTVESTFQGAVGRKPMQRVHIIQALLLSLEAVRHRSGARVRSLTTRDPSPSWSLEPDLPRHVEAAALMWFNGA